VKDPAVPFRRFDVVGDAGSGKSALLQEIARHCADSNLLVLNIAAHRGTNPAGDSAQDRELADLYACSDLIAGLVISIDTFRTGHPGSQAATSRAIDALLRARSLNRLHHLVVNADTSAAPPTGPDMADGNVPPGKEPAPPQDLLAMLRDATESALLHLAEKYPLAILVDDVHLLDREPVRDWLRTLLRRVPSRCTVTARRPESGSWHQGQADDERTIELQNMTPKELREYLRERRLAFTEDEADNLFDWSGGRGLSVAVWCDLALDAGADGFTGLAGRGQQAAGGAGLTDLIELVESAVDQIPVDVLGGPVPLFALLTIADAVTPKLIAMLEDEAGQHPSERAARQIYRRLAAKRFIPKVEGDVEKGVLLYRAIRDEAGQRLLEEDPVLFRDMHSCAELYLRGQVDLEAEIKQAKPFSAWLRFEDPAWLRSVERWLEHATWLGREQFVEMKPALAKLYLDAFWWWDDYLRSAATSILGPALRRVATRQQDTLWTDALREFSDHWVSNFDEAVLRANPVEWRLVLDAIGALLAMFGLQRGRVPGPLDLRRIYILLCNFYGKALWYAGEADADHAGKADEWLADAATACATQPGEKDEDNPNGWIGDWALLRQAEIWSALDPQRSSWYLDGLDRKAIDGGDNDLRVGVGMLTGDLRWRNGEFALALDAYARTLFISCVYNVKQEWTRKAPNLYTKSLYASVIRRVEERIAELERIGEVELIDAALAAIQELFKPYWDRVGSRPDPPALARFALPVPPPPDDAEISTLERENDEIYALKGEYVKALEALALSRENIIERPIVLPLGGHSRGRQRAGMRIYPVPGSGPVVEAFYHQILQPSFAADVLVGLDELQEIADRDSGSVWLAQDEDGTILGGAVGEWDKSVRVVLLSYLAVRPGVRDGGIGGPLFLAALDSWRQRFRPCLVLAELEDPAVPVHDGSEDHGDAAARLRFYLSRGSRVLDIPYFQPALEPGADRVSGLLLLVLHADPDFAGAEDGTIEAGVVRRYLESYQIQYEGKVATDDQAMEMWRALDRPGGVRLREQ
jgi:hypothetical protein